MISRNPKRGNRIYRSCGFIENQDPGLVQQGPGQLESGLHAGRERKTDSIGGLGQSNLLESFVDASFRWCRPIPCICPWKTRFSLQVCLSIRVRSSAGAKPTSLRTW